MLLERICIRLHRDRWHVGVVDLVPVLRTHARLNDVRRMNEHTTECLWRHLCQTTNTIREWTLTWHPLCCQTVSSQDSISERLDDGKLCLRCVHHLEQFLPVTKLGNQLDQTNRVFNRIDFQPEHDILEDITFACATTNVASPKSELESKHTIFAIRSFEQRKDRRRRMTQRTCLEEQINTRVERRLIRLVAIFRHSCCTVIDQGFNELVHLFTPFGYLSESLPH